MLITKQNLFGGKKASLNKMEYLSVQKLSYLKIKWKALAFEI